MRRISVTKNEKEMRMGMCGFLVAAIMPLNDICDTLMRDALHTLKWFVPAKALPKGYEELATDEQTAFKAAYLAKHSWYKHDVKRWGGLARAAIENNLSVASTNRASKRMDELEYEFHDQFEEQIKPYTKALYWSIRNAMAKADYTADVSDLVAQIEIAEVLLGQTCGYFDEGNREFSRRCGNDLTLTFAALRPTQAYKAWGKVVELVAAKLTGKQIDLNSDANIKIATSGLYEQIRSREHCEAAEKNAMLECADKVAMPDEWKKKLQDELQKQLN